jgi:hypothetical protein
MTPEQYAKQLKASSEWKQRNKDKVAAYQKEWRENNIEKRCYNELMGSVRPNKRSNKI